MCLAKLFKHNNKKWTTQVSTFFFSFSKRNKSISSWKWLCPLMTSKNIQQKSSLTWSSTSHLDLCTSMEHAHPSSSSSYAQRVFQMSLKTLGQNLSQNSYDQILHQCEVFSSLWVGRANKFMTTCHFLHCKLP